MALHYKKFQEYALLLMLLMFEFTIIIRFYAPTISFGKTSASRKAWGSFAQIVATPETAKFKLL